MLGTEATQKPVDGWTQNDSWEDGAVTDAAASSAIAAAAMMSDARFRFMSESK